MAPANVSKPSVFIGSSGGAYQLAVAVHKELEGSVWPYSWKGALELTHTIFDELIARANEVDFAVFVFLLEDAMERHDGKTYLAVRDNVLFEFGLFLGVLGRQRTFAIIPKGAEGSLPADLGGVLFGTFDRDHPDQQQAIKSACGDILCQIGEVGPRERTPAVEFFADLQTASAAIWRAVEQSSERRIAVLASTAGAVIPAVLERKLTGNVSVTIHLVNPDSPLKGVLPPHWADASRDALQRLALLASQKKRLAVDCWLYDHVPCVHGFMIDSRELFIGFYRWEDGTLVGAHAPYRYYRRGPATEDYFLLFESWLNAPTARQIPLPTIA